MFSRFFKDYFSINVCDENRIPSDIIWKECRSDKGSSDFNSIADSSEEPSSISFDSSNVKRTESCLTNFVDSFCSLCDIEGSRTNMSEDFFLLDESDRIYFSSAADLISDYQTDHSNVGCKIVRNTDNKLKNVSVRETVVPTEILLKDDFSKNRYYSNIFANTFNRILPRPDTERLLRIKPFEKFFANSRLQTDKFIDFEKNPGSLFVKTKDSLKFPNLREKSLVGTATSLSLHEIDSENVCNRSKNYSSSVTSNVGDNKLMDVDDRKEIFRSFKLFRRIYSFTRKKPLTYPDKYRNLCNIHKKRNIFRINDDVIPKLLGTNNYFYDEKFDGYTCSFMSSKKNEIPTNERYVRDYYKLLKMKKERKKACVKKIFCEAKKVSRYFNKEKNMCNLKKDFASKSPEKCIEKSECKKITKLFGSYRSINQEHESSTMSFDRNLYKRNCDVDSENEFSFKKNSADHCTEDDQIIKTFLENRKLTFDTCQDSSTISHQDENKSCSTKITKFSENKSNVSQKPLLSFCKNSNKSAFSSKPQYLTSSQYLTDYYWLKDQQDKFESFQADINDYRSIIEQLKAERVTIDDQKTTEEEPLSVDRTTRAFLSIADEERALAYICGNVKGSLIVSEYNNISITADDICCLRDGKWLNDEVINCYTELLQARNDLKAPFDTGTPSCWFMNSFFYEKLQGGSKPSVTYDYNAVKRWTRNKDLFSKDLLLFPVNHERVHWSLGVIDFRQKKICLYDSFGLCSKRFHETMLQYLKDEHEDKKKVSLTNASEWGYLEGGKSLPCPQQENGYDCGVFVCQMAECISAGRKFDFSQLNLWQLRLLMVLEIVDKKVD